jgi:hypothetical protein
MCTEVLLFKFNTLVIYLDVNFFCLRMVLYITTKPITEATIID